MNGMKRMCLFLSPNLFGAVFVLVVVSLLGMARDASGQMIVQPEFDKVTREAAVKEIAELLEEHHLFPDLGKRCAAHILAQLKAGEYDGLQDPMGFADRLTRDLHSIHKDLHLNVTVITGMPVVMKCGCGGEQDDDDDQEETNQQLEKLRRTNFGFEEVKILEGNVGYLHLTTFAPLPYGAESAVAAMNMLAHSDAVIIDLRRNGGGTQFMIEYLASYFLSVPTLLNTTQWRGEDRVRQSWSQPSVPGRNLHDTPLFILTSSYTGSAAEAFAYDMKHHDRATVVGERSAGAAHQVTIHRVGDFFSVMIPSGLVRHPVTESDWEGVGVEPHIRTSDEAALPAAHLEALKAIQAGTEDPERLGVLKWSIATLESRLHPIELSETMQRMYVGDYGPRHITLEEGVLFYQRDGREQRRMVPLTHEVFVLAGLEGFRLRFIRNDQGKVEALEGIYKEGLTDRSPRDT